MRTSGVWIMILAVAAIGFSSSAVAQLEDQCHVELLSGDANPDTDGFEQGEDRAFTFLAQNTGTLDAEASVFISEPPPGWSWPTSMPSISLGGGEEQEFSIDVTYEGEDERDASFTASLENVECQSPLGVATVDGSTNDDQTLTFTHAPIQAPEDGGLPWPWIVFGVIVAGAVVGVPVAYQRRGPRIDATVEESEKDVVAGRGTSFPVTLKNKSSDPAPVRLEVVDVQEGWSALTTLPDLELGGKETRTVYLMVRAPPEAKPGDLCVAKLAVKPEGGPSTTVKTLTRVDEGAQEGPSPSPPEEDEGEDEGEAAAG